MAEHSTIEWTHHTWSPWIGCQKVSPACDGCYAEHLMDTRMGRVEWGPHGERKRTSAAYWRQPLAWNRAAAAAGRVERVFPSLCDPFDNQVDPAWRRDFFDLIRATPHLQWLLLTKRPQNIIAMCEAASGLPENVALGGTAEDQPNANRVVRDLKRARAHLDPAFIFLSMEPLLERVCLLEADAIRWIPGGFFDDGGAKGYEEDGVDRHECVDWVITGGETDQGKHKARPSHPDWFRQIRDACTAAGVPYLHKQNGEWLPAGDWYEHHPVSLVLRQYRDGHWQEVDGADPGEYVCRIGKKAAGRLLDGIEHNGFPGVFHG